MFFLSLIALSSSSVRIGNFYYNIYESDLTASVEGSYIKMSDVVIPKVVSDGTYTYQVDTIGTSAFSGNYNITSLTTFSSLKFISYNAFYNCRNLRTVNLGYGLLTIGKNAFENCINLQSIIIPDSVTTLYGSSYSGDSPFYGCSSLNSITLPASLTITTSSFYLLFRTNYNLTRIQIGSNLEPLTFHVHDNLVYDKYDYSLIYCPLGITAEIQITKRFSYIEDYAFQYTNVTSVILPDSVVSIGEYAFYYSKISSIEIPSSVTYIGKYAFYQCRSLTNVRFHNSPMYINDYAFYGSGLTGALQIPVDFIKLGSSVFSNTYLQYVYLEGCKLNKSIGSNAFDYSRLACFIVPDSCYVQYSMYITSYYIKYLNECPDYYTYLMPTQTPATRIVIPTRTPSSTSSPRRSDTPGPELSTASIVVIVLFCIFVALPILFFLVLCCVKVCDCDCSCCEECCCCCCKDASCDDCCDLCQFCCCCCCKGGCFYECCCKEKPRHIVDTNIDSHQSSSPPPPTPAPTPVPTPVPAAPPQPIYVDYNKTEESPYLQENPYAQQNIYNSPYNYPDEKKTPDINPKNNFIPPQTNYVPPQNNNIYDNDDDNPYNNATYF